MYLFFIEGVAGRPLGTSHRFCLGTGIVPTYVQNGLSTGEPLVSKEETIFYFCQGSDTVTVYRLSVMT